MAGSFDLVTRDVDTSREMSAAGIAAPAYNDWFVVKWIG
jgi:hypothetical protein